MMLIVRFRWHLLTVKTDKILFQQYLADPICTHKPDGDK